MNRRQGIQCCVVVLTALMFGPAVLADEGDPLKHDVSPALRDIVSMPIPSSPMDAVQLKGLLEKTNLWAGFGGPCGERARGEINVAFDPKSQRWVTSRVVEDLRCTAVSVTADAMGPYDRYSVAASVLACDATCQAGYLSEHNRVRTRVNAGLMPAPSGFQPIPAPPLASLSWDAGIAGGSQAWANGCSAMHSGAPGLGENLYYSAGSVPTPATAVASWESESTDYTYAAIGDPVNNFDDIGHYTQLVWANTSLVGCGVTHCTTNTPVPRLPRVGLRRVPVLSCREFHGPIPLHRGDRVLGQRRVQRRQCVHQRRLQQPRNAHIELLPRQHRGRVQRRQRVHGPRRLCHTQLRHDAELRRRGGSGAALGMDVIGDGHRQSVDDGEHEQRHGAELGVRVRRSRGRQSISREPRVHDRIVDRDADLPEPLELRDSLRIVSMPGCWRSRSAQDRSRTS